MSGAFLVVILALGWAGITGSFSGCVTSPVSRSTRFNALRPLNFPSAFLSKTRSE